MPQAAAGTNIADSAQINPGVIQNSDIANNAIDNNKMADNAIGNAEMADSAITNTEVAAGAGIVDTKLATISTAGKVDGAALTNLANIPAGAGTIPVANLPSVGAKINVTTSGATIVNTAAESNLLSLSLAGGTLGTNNAVRIQIWFDGTNTFTGTPTLTFRFKYGGTTIATSAAITIDTNNRRGWIECLLLAAGATNSQEGSMLVHSHNNSTTHRFDQQNGTAAADSTALQTLAVTAQWSVADPSNSITVAHAVVEKIS